MILVEDPTLIRIYQDVPSPFHPPRMTFRPSGESQTYVRSASLFYNLPSFLASLPVVLSQVLTAIFSLFGLSRQRGVECVSWPITQRRVRSRGDQRLGLISKRPCDTSFPPDSPLSLSGGGGDSQTALWPLHLALDWNN